MLAEDAWPALVDPNQLTTAILNLALNARDAMPDGGKLTLETRNVYLDEGYASMNSEVTPGHYVMVAVSDTGTGIPAAIREQGVRALLHHQGGRQGHRPRAQHGVRLRQAVGRTHQDLQRGRPRHHDQDLPAARERIGADRRRGRDTCRHRGGNETILVVEDDALVRNYVDDADRRASATPRWRPRTRPRRSQIIDANTQIDLLFTDVIMPGAMNGRQLADEALKRRPGLKTLFTSGYTENAIVHHGRLDPGVLLLAKPYRKSELARMIRMALGG